MHTAVSPASALFFDSERNWVTSLLQLEGSTWAALTANGHLRLLDATSSMLSPNPVELHQNTFIQKWGPHELLAASGHQLSLHDVRQPQPAFILTGNGKPYSSFAVHSQRNQAAVGTELAQSEALVELW